MATRDEIVAAALGGRKLDCFRLGPALLLSPSHALTSSDGRRRRVIVYRDDRIKNVEHVPSSSEPGNALTRAA